MASLLYDRRPAPGQQGLGGTRHLWVAVAALAAIFLSHPIGAEPPKEIRRILILNEAGTSYPAIAIINQGIQTALNDSPYRLEFYSEYMDTLLFPDPADQQEFRDFYLRKYQNRKPDVIITVGPSPLKFMQEVHQRAFPGVPIVFCLPNRGMPGAPALDSDFTGVENDMAPAQDSGSSIAAPARHRARGCGRGRIGYRQTAGSQREGGTERIHGPSRHYLYDGSGYA